MKTKAAQRQTPPVSSAKQDAAEKAAAMWAALKSGDPKELARWNGDPGWAQWRSGGSNKSTFLHSAPSMTTNAPFVLNFLLEQGLEVDARDKNGRTPLHRCWGLPASRRDPWATALLAAGADPRATDNQGRSVWARVFLGSDTRWPERLTAAGVEPTPADVSEECLQHVSNADLFKIALRKANLSKTVRSRLFLRACQQKPDRIARLLLEEGVDITMTLDGQDALAWTCSRNTPDTEIVSRLVELGADPDRPMVLPNGQPVTARSLVHPAQREKVETAFVLGRARLLENTLKEALEPEGLIRPRPRM